MAVSNKFNVGAEYVMDGVLDLFGSPVGDTLRVGLTNTAPNVADTHLDTVLSPDVIEATSNAAEVGAAGGYLEGGITLANTNGTRAAGTVTVVADQAVWTATADAFPPFRYVYLYDNTAVAAATRPIFAWWAYGVGGLDLLNGETFSFRPSGLASGGALITLV